MIRCSPIRVAGVLAASGALALCSPRLLAQNRGVYPLGMSATNSGVVAEPGVTYVNAFLFYARDESRGPDGEILATGANSVLMDMNTVAWVSERIGSLGGAKFSISATVPIANNSLSSDVQGALSGGGGLADSYYQPLILGWSLGRADIRAAYGFLAPTGRFNAGANDNVGSGYWTHTLSAGETFSLTKDRATSLSAFQLYEFHGTQEGTGIHPGQTLSLDYSLMRTVQVQPDFRLQVGLAGYSQWQTTDKTGPGVTAAEAAARYRVNALGLAAGMMLPGRKVSIGTKYFKEFSNRSTFQGYSIQISAAISL